MFQIFLPINSPCCSLYMHKTKICEFHNYLVYQVKCTIPLKDEGLGTALKMMVSAVLLAAAKGNCYENVYNGRTFQLYYRKLNNAFKLTKRLIFSE